MMDLKGICPFLAIGPHKFETYCPIVVGDPFVVGSAVHTSTSLTVLFSSFGLETVLLIRIYSYVYLTRTLARLCFYICFGPIVPCLLQPPAFMMAVCFGCSDTLCLIYCISVLMRMPYVLYNIMNKAFISGFTLLKLSVACGV
jgi:hypothetical protein